MINLALSFAIGVAVALLVVLTHLPVWAAIGPGLIAFVAAYILLARRISVKVQALAAVAQKDLSAMSGTMNQRERQARIDRAVKILESGLVYARWQFLVGSELHAQIGMIKYMVKDYDGAAQHLAHANARNYMAKAFQGALQYLRKNYKDMEVSFETAVVSGKKEPIVWAVYAWCLTQLKEKDKAIAVLSRAVEKNPSDEKLKANLNALQNDKRLKMKAYEPMWWQFGLEAPPLEYSGGPRVRFQRR